MTNVMGYGAAQAKTGDNRKALDRAAGYSATVAACQNSTRSRYKGSSKHNHYEGCGGYGDNENIHGYSHGGGGGGRKSY